MSILLYRDRDGRDVVIKNPTMADWSECFRIISERLKGDIDREFARDMRGSLLLEAIAGQGGKGHG